MTFARWIYPSLLFLLVACGGAEFTGSKNSDSQEAPPVIQDCSGDECKTRDSKQPNKDDKGGCQEKGCKPGDGDGHDKGGDGDDHDHGGNDGQCDKNDHDCEPCDDSKGDDPYGDYCQDPCKDYDDQCGGHDGDDDHDHDHDHDDDPGQNDDPSQSDNPSQHD